VGLVTVIDGREPEPARCVSCRRPDIGPSRVRLDIDTTASPPELVCPRCRRKPRCSSCGRRKNRLTIESRDGATVGVCGDCIRRRAADYAAGAEAREAFGQAVCDLAARDYEERGIDALVTIPGVFEALVEHYHNEAAALVAAADKEDR
jgi:hypothetical protein